MFSTAEIARDIRNWIETRPDVMPERPPRRQRRQRPPYQPMQVLRREPGQRNMAPRRQYALHATEVWGDMPQWPSRCPPTPPPPIYPRDSIAEEMEMRRKRSGPPIPTTYYVVQDEPGKPTGLIEVPRPRWASLPQPAIPAEPGVLAELKTDPYGNIKKNRRRAHFGAPNNPYPTAHLMEPDGHVAPPAAAAATRASATPSTGAMDTPSRGTTTARTARGRPRSNAISLPREPIPPQHVDEELTAAEWRMRVRLAAIRERARAPVTPPVVMPVSHEEDIDWGAYPETAALNGTSSLQAQVQGSWRVFDEYMAGIQPADNTDWGGSPEADALNNEEDIDLSSEYPETAALNDTPSFQAPVIDWGGYSETDALDGTLLRAQVEAYWKAFDEYMDNTYQQAHNSNS
ncbi:uncharacterized protein J7T54_001104 [Emericellopsis cladophorae]|uniref:Uncharacterized protein n=1 Tax=Emericellopsis cladophorae TaxID=2686198 RepID=A0A9P9Y019_9HYPO|nr:uncharacterized protein J7T54_001104 [Emericellopsis cladophorae]KAI6780796.1 hypothetical protein J7T54_001104 [Emericellopsis cladophorae]